MEVDQVRDEDDVMEDERAKVGERHGCVSRGCVSGGPNLPGGREEDGRNGSESGRQGGFCYGRVGADECRLRRVSQWWWWWWR